MLLCYSLSIPKGGGSKTQNGRFRYKSHFAWRKAAVQSFFVWKLSVIEDTFIGPGYYPCENDWRGTSLSTWNFGSHWPRWNEFAVSRSIFASSASAVTSSEKSSSNTNNRYRSPLYLRFFPMSPRWTSYVVSTPPHLSSTSVFHLYL